MAIIFSCPQCDKTYSAKDENAGKKTKCKHCGTTIPIPSDIPDPDSIPLKPIPTPTTPPPLPPSHPAHQHHLPTTYDEPAPHIAIPLPPSTQTPQRTSAAKPPRSPSTVRKFFVKCLQNPTLLFFLAIHLAAFIGYLVCVSTPGLSHSAGYVYLIIAGSWILAGYLFHLLIPIYGNIIFITAFLENFGTYCRRFAISSNCIPFFIFSFLLFFHTDTPGASRSAPPPSQITSSTPPNFSPSSTPAPNPLAFPDTVDFPPLPALSPLEPTIDSTSITITGTGPASQMTLYLYLPHKPTTPPLHSLACIFIAPAGTTTLNGSRLGDGDRPEHLPYVRAGYAVCAYELDGDTPEQPNAHQLVPAIAQFRDAHAGLLNARNAIEYVLAKVPQVDPNRLYAAGHSSAATVALNLASQDPRIKAALAYAPITDTLQFQSEANITVLEHLLPGTRAFARDASPISHVSTLNSPVFLFHTQDDSTVSSTQIDPYVAALQAAHKSVTYRQVPTGDHYDSMIHDGIPAGIAWLQQLPAEALAFRDPAPSTVAVARAPSPTFPAPLPEPLRTSSPSIPPVRSDPLPPPAPIIPPAPPENPATLTLGNYTLLPPPDAKVTQSTNNTMTLTIPHNPGEQPTRINIRILPPNRLPVPAGDTFSSNGINFTRTIRRIGYTFGSVTYVGSNPDNSFEIIVGGTTAHLNDLSTALDATIKSLQRKTPAP